MTNNNLIGACEKQCHFRQWPVQQRKGKEEHHRKKKHAYLHIAPVNAINGPTDSETQRELTVAVIL